MKLPGGQACSLRKRLVAGPHRREPVLARTSRPYQVRGGRYFFPMKDLAPYQAVGEASWYGRGYHGRRTSSGEVFDMCAMTAAHPTLPIPSYARVTRLDSRQSVVVRINDRGPFVRDRLIDLSFAAARELGYERAGIAKVQVDLLLPGED